MDDILVSYGGAVKAAAGSTLIEGLLLPFGSPDDLDHDGEFFSAKTDLGVRLPAALKLFYGHGMNAKVGRVPLAWAQLDLRDDGVWFKADLGEDLEWLEEERETARKYQALTLQLAQEKALGASSGAASHVVVKRAATAGKWISRWPLAEASVTPRPANAKTFGRVALKSLAGLAGPEEALAALAGRPPSLAENTEQWLDRGEDVLAQFQRLGQAEVKVGRPQFSAARVERMQRMFLLLQDLLHECGGMPQVEEPPAPGMGAMLEGEFLATLARQNGVPVDAPSPAASAAGA